MHTHRTRNQGGNDARLRHDNRTSDEVIKMVDGMRERTTLEIASRLESLMPIAGRSAVKALRQQHDEIDRLKRDRHHIYDLLARIHRDGGQYTAEHGVEKSCDDAEEQVAAWLDTINSVDALIEQARIAKSEACARICEKSLSREEAAYLIRARSAK